VAKDFNIRELRWADPRRGKGRRGGLRVIYYYFPNLAKPLESMATKNCLKIGVYSRWSKSEGTDFGIGGNALE
jgi:hypothetical protein